MNRDTKEQVASALHEVLESANLVVVTHFSGMTVAESTDLRRQMKEAGASFRVTKNSLAKRALEGTQFSSLSEMFSGPVAIAVSEDPVAAARVVVGFAKKNEKLVIVGGALGTDVLDPVGVKALAELPSLDELRAKLVGLVQAPATKVAGVLQAPAGQLARVCGAYGTKEDAA